MVPVDPLGPHLRERGGQDFVSGPARLHLRELDVLHAIELARHRFRPSGASVSPFRST